MDVLERALVQYASASAGIIAGAVVGMAIIVGTAPMFNTFLIAALPRSTDWQSFAVLSVVGGLQLALFVGALREAGQARLGVRRGAQRRGHARHGAAAGRLGHGAARSLARCRQRRQRHLGGHDQGGIPRQGSPPLRPTRGVKRILEAHERALRPGRSTRRAARRVEENWIETAIEANSRARARGRRADRPARPAARRPAPAGARPAPYAAPRLYGGAAARGGWAHADLGATSVRVQAGRVSSAIRVLREASESNGISLQGLHGPVSGLSLTFQRTDPYSLEPKIPMSSGTLISRLR